MSGHTIKKKIFDYNEVTCACGVLSFNGVELPAVNMYFVDGLLFDTGPLVFKDEFHDFYTETPIRQIAITHIHEDHTGMAAWLKKKLNVPVYVHKDLVERAGTDDPLSPYHLMIWGERKGFEALPAPEILHTPRYSFKVVNSPGHHASHHVFFEEKMGWLFSGDMYIHHKQDVAYKSENITAAIETIKSILELDFETLFCYHAGIIEDGKARMKEKLEFFLEFKETVSDMRQKGMTDEEIDAELFPRKHIITVLSEGEWSSINMIKTV